MNTLFEPIQVGDYQLGNRILMAPLTRGRAVEASQPNGLMADYYAQRASAGLLITEATAVAADGLGWVNAPGIFTSGQQAGWSQVAEAVHEREGRIFMQLWHMGSVVHPDFLGGELPISSSAVKQQGALVTPKGRDREFVVPRAMGAEDIQRVIQSFVTAARRAVDAGMDGVEIHAANGFLIDQFIRDGVNQRQDEYGGTVDNRLRFMLEVVDAVTKEVGAGKVGIRLSPSNAVWGISDSDPAATFGRAVERLNEFDLAYLHVLEALPLDEAARKHYLTPMLKAKYQGVFIANGGYDHQAAQGAVAEGLADAVAFGSLYIANPDLVERFEQGAELTTPDPATFYTPGAKGYTDYPRLGNTG